MAHVLTFTTVAEPSLGIHSYNPGDAMSYVENKVIPVRS